MTQLESRKVLEKCFAALPKRDRDRLKFHYEQKTRIVCGDDSSLFSDGIGGG